MNLSGCRIQAITAAIGSNDSVILDRASTHLSDILSDVSARLKAQAWLQTLVGTGYPLRSARQPPALQDDGSLLVHHLEAEIHICAIHSLVQALNQEDYLDLAGESSHWSHPAITALSDDLRACGFTRSDECPASLFTWLSALSYGTPLFGDGFQTEWSFYSFVANEELQSVIADLAVAMAYERPLPDYIPDDVRKTMNTRLSDNGQEFARELSGWFERIQQAGQDAYVIWW